MRARRRHVALGLMLAGVAVLLAACGRPAPPPAPEPAPSAPTPIGTIVFDMGHGEIFGAEDATELGQSQAVQQMRNAGFSVTVNRSPIDEGVLRGASGLVLAGPMQPLTGAEYAAVTTFAKNGGTVLLTIHVPFPVMAVPAHWGMPVGSFVIQSDRPATGSPDAGVFVADKIVPSELTSGVRGVYVLSGWPVEAASPEAKIVVRTGASGWLDRNRSRSHDSTESADLGIIGVTRLGKGYVVVSGDDAVFANIGIGQADNAALLDNILRLVAAKRSV